MEMNVDEFLDKIKKIQIDLLDYLDHEDMIEEKLQNLINIFEDIKIHDNRFKIKLVIHLILKISNNHHRESQFFSKIEKIMQFFKDDMTKYFTNEELFQFFESNKRLLLFLFEEKIIVMDKSIVKQITSQAKYTDSKYPEYFQPEIQPYVSESLFPKIKDEDFYEKRKIGENDNEICKLIQKDMIKEFIIYLNKNNYPVNSTISPSIYETNNFLLKKNQNITLIEYAVFFGSVQIFNYLRKNGAELKSSLWLYEVHGKNSEIIHSLEENNILLLNENEEEEEDGDYNISAKQIFKESIKCHHNDVGNYIQYNYLQNKNEYSKDTLIDGLKYYNFMFIQNDSDNDYLFYYSCKYDYYLLAFILLKDMNIDINKKQIYIVFFLMIFKTISFNRIQNNMI